MDRWRPVTGAVPEGTTGPEREALRSKALGKLRRRAMGRSPCKSWMGTREVDVPGWVLGELAAEGLVEGRKGSGGSPNEWRK